MEKRLENVAARVSPERADRFRRACDAHGVSASEQINNLIGVWVEEQERLYRELSRAFGDGQVNEGLAASKRAADKDETDGS